MHVPINKAQEYNTCMQTHLKSFSSIEYLGLKIGWHLVPPAVQYFAPHSPHPQESEWKLYTLFGQRYVDSACAHVTHLALDCNILLVAKYVCPYGLSLLFWLISLHHILAIITLGGSLCMKLRSVLPVVLLQLPMHVFSFCSSVAIYTTLNREMAF